GEACRVPDLGARAEGGPVPVVARALADGDLDLLHARGPIRVRAAEADGRAAGVPTGRGVARARGRERPRRAGRDRVDRPRVLGRGRIGVAGAVVRLHLEGVASFREGRVALRARAGREAAAVDLALEGRGTLVRTESARRT